MRIKFAVIGCGHIGKRHAEMILRNPQAELVALIDSKSKDQLNIDQYQVPFFNSLEDFWQSGIEVDVVNIATPNGFHAGHAISTLEHDTHVVIEKPITLNSADAERIISLAEMKNKHVFTVMQNRYSPPSAWMKKMLQENRLGKVFFIQINCFWNRDERYYTEGSWHGRKDLDGGTLFTQFSHFIDILIWCFGTPVIQSAVLHNFNHQQNIEFEDSGIVHFEVEGTIGQLNYSTSVWDKNLESSILILAENGTIKIGGQYMDKVEHCHVQGYEMPELEPTAAGNDYGGYKGSAQNHHRVIQHVIDVILGRESMDITALEGLKVVSTIEEIYRQGAGKLN